MNEVLNAENNYGFSENFKPSKENPGYMEKVVRTKHGTGIILRPILQPEERTRREQEIMHDLARIVAPYI